DMLIGSEYSKQVQRIFGEDVTNKSITQLLYPNDSDKEMFVRLTLESILDEDDFKQEILISLLETDFVINEKFITVQYKILNSQTFMMILTDITSKKELDKKIHEKQQILKMVVEIVITKEQFLEVKKDYDLFIEKIDLFKSIDQLEALRKEIHTYKGLFAQKEMLHIVNSLHDFESLIDDSLKKKRIDPEILQTTTQEMKNWLEKDLSIVKEILGNDYFSKKEYIEISKFRLNQIYKDVINYTNEPDKQKWEKIVDDIKNLQLKNIRIFFRPYSKLVEQLAANLGKNINPLVEEIENIYIPDEFIPFLNTLVHLFRNSVDHGIETPEHRYETTKDEFATIKCIVKKQDHKLIIEISDDGNGVDTEKVKSILIEKGIYTQEQVALLSEEEVVLSIFKDSFSTSDKITTISGRGVGLASVMEELSKLNGTVQVKNQIGIGLEFKFEVPFN
ncbi:MAG: hypothetical protein IE909_07285, partial [Campylobacterales bacterium]|nr:hypothetical protein [Campylobacterales bacterium]